MPSCRAYVMAAVIAFIACTLPVFADEGAPIRLDAANDAATYCSRIWDALMLGDFDTLEATAERARALKMHFPGGKAELQVFYESFTKESCSQRYSSLREETAKARIALVAGWLGKMPDSPTARIASAMVWSQYAWTGRGSGFANQVSQEQWAAFAERSQRALEFIRPVDPDRDAQAYLVMFGLARDLGASREQIDAIFRQAHERFPSYLGYYADYASAILPKWYGRPGEAADYVKSLLTDPGGDLGAMAYSRAAERLAWEMQSSDVYRDTGATWENLRRGFALREHRDGLDKMAWITLCYFAVKANDRAAAREAYGHVDKLEEWPEGGMHNFFLTVLPWIMQRD